MSIFREFADCRQFDVRLGCSLNTCKSKGVGTGRVGGLLDMSRSPTPEYLHKVLCFYILHNVFLQLFFRSHVLYREWHFLSWHWNQYLPDLRPRHVALAPGATVPALICSAHVCLRAKRSWLGEPFGGQPIDSSVSEQGLFVLGSCQWTCVGTCWLPSRGLGVGGDVNTLSGSKPYRNLNAVSPLNVSERFLPLVYVTVHADNMLKTVRHSVTSPL